MNFFDMYPPNCQAYLELQTRGGYRLARILKAAADTLGSVDKARVWLGRPHCALGGVPPLALLDTEVGARQVDDALTRINYGMYA